MSAHFVQWRQKGKITGDVLVEALTRRSHILMTCLIKPISQSLNHSQNFQMRLQNLLVRQVLEAVQQKHYPNQLAAWQII